MNYDNVMTLLWVVWFGMFAAVEIVAIVDHRRNDTLSEHLRSWFRVKTKPGRAIFLAVFGAFTMWFVFHIALGVA